MAIPFDVISEKFSTQVITTAVAISTFQVECCVNNIQNFHEKELHVVANILRIKIVHRWHTCGWSQAAVVRRRSLSDVLREDRADFDRPPFGCFENPRSRRRFRRLIDVDRSTSLPVRRPTLQWSSSALIFRVSVAPTTSITVTPLLFKSRPLPFLVRCQVNLLPVRPSKGFKSGAKILLTDTCGLTITWLAKNG